MIKKTICFLVIAVLFVSYGDVFAREAFNSVNDFGRWMTFYYLNPQPAEIPDVMIYFSESPLYSSNAHVPTASFFAAIFRKNTGLMKQTYKYIESEGGANARIVMIESLYLTSTSESRELLAKAEDSWFSPEIRPKIESLLADLPTEPLQVRINDPKLGPRDLDCLWTSFSATGDKAPILKLISLMRLKKEGSGIEIIIGGAAEWSLGSNARVHKKVLDICREELKNSKGLTREFLENIVQQSGINSRI